MTQPIARLLPLLLAAVFLVNCASAPASRGADVNTLTQADIAEAGSIFTAREAVRLLRPQWLAPPLGRVASSNVLSSGGGGQAVIVYIDDIRQPDVESLATVPAAKILMMKYLDQNRAVLLRGPGHENGVIEVTTVDKRK